MCTKILFSCDNSCLKGNIYACIMQTSGCYIGYLIILKLLKISFCRLFGHILQSESSVTTVMFGGMNILQMPPLCIWVSVPSYAHARISCITCGLFACCIVHWCEACFEDIASVLKLKIFQLKVAGDKSEKNIIKKRCALLCECK